MYKKVSGFTLIELLVVIAIIGLLTSTIFVALNNSRSRAANTQTYANAKILAVATNNFFNETGAMPTVPDMTSWACNWTGNAAQYANWTAFIDQLYNAKQISTNLKMEANFAGICYYPFTTKTSEIFMNLSWTPGPSPCTPRFGTYAYCIPASSY